MALSYQSFHRLYNNLPPSEIVTILHRNIPQSKPDGYVEVIHVPVQNYISQLSINQQIRQSHLDRNNIPFDQPSDVHFFLEHFGSKPSYYVEVASRVLPETSEKISKLTPFVVERVNAYYINLAPVRSNLYGFTQTVRDQISVFDAHLLMNEASMSTTFYFNNLSVNDSLELFETFVDYPEQILPIMLPLLTLHFYKAKDSTNFLVLLKDLSLNKTEKFTEFCSQAYKNHLNSNTFIFGRTYGEHFKFSMRDFWHSKTKNLYLYTSFFLWGNNLKVGSLKSKVFLFANGFFK